jgi:hypothetical protein
VLLLAGSCPQEVRLTWCAFRCVSGVYICSVSVGLEYVFWWLRSSSFRPVVIVLCGAKLVNLGFFSALLSRACSIGYSSRF